MRKKLLYSTLSLIVSVAVFITSPLQAQVTHTTIKYGAPTLINFHERALYDILHPQALKKRAIEQGEDREHYKFVPKPAPANAIVHPVDLKAPASLTQAAAGGVLHAPPPT